MKNYGNLGEVEDTLRDSSFLKMLTSIDKCPSSFACFSASSGDEGMLSLADIRQIADVICMSSYLMTGHY